MIINQECSYPAKLTPTVKWLRYYLYGVKHQSFIQCKLTQWCYRQFWKILMRFYYLLSRVFILGNSSKFLCSALEFRTISIKPNLLISYNFIELGMKNPLYSLTLHLYQIMSQGQILILTILLWLWKNSQNGKRIGSTKENREPTGNIGMFQRDCHNLPFLCSLELKVLVIDLYWLPVPQYQMSDHAILYVKFANFFPNCSSEPLDQIQAYLV